MEDRLNEYNNLADRDLSPIRSVPGRSSVNSFPGISAGGIMKEIPLTQEKFALVDDDMFEELNQHKWFAIKHRNTFYAMRNLPMINGKRMPIKMNHVILGKPLKGFVHDHKDGNGLNNQRDNLRIVTSRQNSQNMKNIIQTSHYPGVHWCKQSKKWRARIKINGIKKSLGFFVDEYKAFEAYRSAVHNLGEAMVGE